MNNVCRLCREAEAEGEPESVVSPPVRSVWLARLPADSKPSVDRGVVCVAICTDHVITRVIVQNGFENMYQISNRLTISHQQGASPRRLS